jgi:hypothetical protein
MIAEKNGYKGHLGLLPMFIKRDPSNKKKLSKKQFSELVSRVWLSKKNDIIFSHDFMKSLFGEHAHEKICPNCGALWSIPSHCCGYQDYLEETGLKPYCDRWEFHYIKMMLGKNPIDYLRRYMENKTLLNA